MDRRYVLVTTSYRGVFCGEIDDGYADTDTTIALRRCRNVIKWRGGNGFLGLAATGPGEGSVLGSTADRVVLQGVTSVADCTEEARKALTEWPA
jgi:hypothetical protein